MLPRKLTGMLGAGIFALAIAAAAAPAHAATLTVNTTADTGPGSLRDQIDAANGTAARDTIAFAIPGPGVHVITLAGDLPAITEPVAIRGYSQHRGSSPATASTPAVPTIVIDATMANYGLQLNVDRSEVSGLVIYGAGWDGIRVWGNENVIAGNHLGTDPAGTAAMPNGFHGVHIDGNDNVIGGPTPAERNVISGFGEAGVHVNATDNRIEGNYLGTDATGTVGLDGGTVEIQSSLNTVTGNLISGNSSSSDGVLIAGDENTVQGNLVGTDASGLVALGNRVGINVDGGDQNVIGGAAADEGNVVSGNTWTGVRLASGADGPAEGNDVQGNQIGTTTTAAGMSVALPNHTGVRIVESNDNTIGGTNGQGNVISGNESDGVRIEDDGADDNRVQGNWIGTDQSGATVLGNGQSGVEIDGNRNRVGDPAAQSGANVIANNGGDGVTVTSGVDNGIVRNSMYDNGALSIDLGADGGTGNDADDVDVGANNLQNGPEIQSARSTTTEVEWELDSESLTTYRLEFFASTTCNGTIGEAQRFLGAIEDTTDVNGNVDGLDGFALVTGEFVTMTATELDGGGSTSELSPCEKVVDA